MIQPLNPPPRGFACREFEARTEQLQRAMAQQAIDAVFFTTEPEFRYFSGFHSQFWESPTRPWFLVVPATGKPIAVVPEIGAIGFEQTWIEDVRSWPSPRPEDDGISLLTDTLKTLSQKHQRIGAMLGPETHLRMPANNFATLKHNLSTRDWVDISTDMRNIRSIKSAAEIEKIRFIDQVTAAGFAHLKTHMHLGITERQACKQLRQHMLSLGADHCPYIIAASGPDGYNNIIMGPTDRVLEAGDVLIIDTGACFDGYFSDFDRNYAFGHATTRTLQAYEALYQTVEAGLATAAPERTTGDLWQAMWSVLEAAGTQGNSVGRLGHGLGMQLTEWPSHVPQGDAVLQPGMVITLEPTITLDDGMMMTHEENIVITESGCELLHERTWRDMPIIE